MSLEISVLIRKNSRGVIRVISNQSLTITRSVQSDRRYYQYNNEGSDEMIPLSSIPLTSELLWQQFPPVFLKLQLCQLGSNIPSPSCTPTRTSLEINTKMKITFRKNDT
jgi:hypothetical protein